MSEWDAFDRELAESLAELPPAPETVQAVTPWRNSFDRIILGLCLTCFTLNFLYLQYILPAIGTVQLYLGFRALRKNNIWFKFGWIFSICKAILLYISLLLNATPYADILPVSRALAQAVATVLLFAALRQALRQAAADLNQVSQKDPVLWALLWYLLIIFLGLFWPEPGWFVGGAVIVAFVCVIRSLVRAAQELDHWGYAVQAAPVKIGTTQFQWLFHGSLLVLILLCGLFFGHIQLAGTSIQQTFDSPEIASTRSRLLDLGFPQEMLDYLPKEELEKLTEASACVFLPNDPDGQWDLQMGGHPFTTSGTMVYLGNGTARFYVLAEYDDATSLYWQNLAEFRDSGIARWDGACYLTYRKHNAAYRAVVPVTEQVETVDNYFTGPVEETRIRARYSFPAGAEERTCLFVCSLQLLDLDQSAPGTYYYHNCIVNFYRDRLPMHYPYQLFNGGSSKSRDLSQYCQTFEFQFSSLPYKSD